MDPVALLILSCILSVEEEADEAAQEEAPEDEAEIQVGRSMECPCLLEPLRSVAVY
jgi:hypothetical protein